jgi:hypothetical protein
MVGRPLYLVGVWLLRHNCAIIAPLLRHYCADDEKPFIVEE